MAELKTQAEEFQRLYANGTQLSPEKQKELNQVLFKVERTLINEKGCQEGPGTSTRCMRRDFIQVMV
jgi:hypothetical protein